MLKVNFQDGTKVSNAKVTIDEVDYPVTPARYDGATPLSSTVMNTMQDNIEDAIDQNANNIGGQDYDATSTYDVGDIVKYQGQLYICTTAITTAEAWNSNHWQATDVLSSAGGNEIAIGSASDITGKTKIFVNESTQTLQYKDTTTGQFTNIAGDEVFIGDEEDAPEDAKIIIEDEDFGEDAGLSKAEVYVGAEEPTTGEKVWLRKGKNLFNKKNIINGFRISMSGSNYADTEYFVSEYIKVEDGVKYSVNYEVNALRRIAWYDNNKKLIGYTDRFTTFTLPVNTEFIRICGEKSLADTAQLECGPNATSYEDYIEPQIFVRNSNGVYEEFIKKHEEVYSTEEVKIGTWVDGKSLYRKVISSTLPKVTTENVEAKKTVSIDADIGTGFIETAYSYNDSQVIPIPFIFSGGQVIKAYIGLDGSITLSSNTTYANEQQVIVIVCYTKTTD